MVLSHLSRAFFYNVPTAPKNRFRHLDTCALTASSVIKVFLGFHLCHSETKMYLRLLGSERVQLQEYLQVVL
jgi:hypothetical protein